MHKPANWVVVCDSPLTVSSACTCGNDECHFTAVAYDAVNTNLDPIGHVKI